MIKKFLIMTALCAALLLAVGCGKSDIIRDGGAVTVKSARLGLKFPEDFTVLTDGEVYKRLYEQMSDIYGSADELKKEFEANGESVRVMAYSDDVSAMLIQLEKEDISIPELMQSVHSNGIFDYRASGYFTDSTLEETEVNGISGVMSTIRIYEEQGAPLLLEECEFCFELENGIYTLQITVNKESGDPLGGVELEITD